jgi:hypothetical protein
VAEQPQKLNKLEGGCGEKFLRIQNRMGNPQSTVHTHLEYHNVCPPRPNWDPPPPLPQASMTIEVSHMLDRKSGFFLLLVTALFTMFCLSYQSQRCLILSILESIFNFLGKKFLVHRLFHMPGIDTNPITHCKYLSIFLLCF